MFCTNCGKEIDDKAVVCVGCGVATQIQSEIPKQGKSYIATLLLCLFLGGIGAHRFYVGKTGSGVTMLLLVWVFSWITLGITAIIGGIWAFVDFIVILTGNFKTKDGKELVR